MPWLARAWLVTMVTGSTVSASVRAIMVPVTTMVCSTGAGPAALARGGAGVVCASTMGVCAVLCFAIPFFAVAAVVPAAGPAAAAGAVALLAGCASAARLPAAQAASTPSASTRLTESPTKRLRLMMKNSPRSRDAVVPGRAHHSLRNNNEHHFCYTLPVGKVSHERTAMSRNESADSARPAASAHPPAKLARHKRSRSDRHRLVRARARRDSEALPSGSFSAEDAVCARGDAFFGLGGAGLERLPHFAVHDALEVVAGRVARDDAPPEGDGGGVAQVLG